MKDLQYNELAKAEVFFPIRWGLHSIRCWLTDRRVWLWKIQAEQHEACFSVLYNRSPFVPSKEEKQQKLYAKLQEVGKLAAELGVENGHWFMLDLRTLQQKAKANWNVR